MMDELQPELSGSPMPGDEVDKATGITVGEEYQTSEAGVSYRVLQVSEADEQNLIAASLPPGTQVAQAVLSSPFSGAGATVDGNGDTTFAYIPASAVNAGGDNDAVAVTNLTSSGGQFYVMMSPQDVIQGQRPATVRNVTASTAGAAGGKYNRDDRRRNTHNEVERRRRDKINNWIVTLSKLIPDCAEASNTSSAVSKSGILSKACEYISDLKTANLRLAESLKDVESFTMENEMLRQQLEQSKDENNSLRRTIEQSGLVSAVLPTTPPDAQ